MGRIVLILRIANIIAIMVLAYAVCYWGAEVCDVLRYRPVVVKIERVAYDVSASDGTTINIVEGCDK